MPSNLEPTRGLFEPTPIPEAKAFKWSELLPPTREALHDLLWWLKAACDTSTQQDKGEHVSTSLLVHGGRGTGKTTVLLSAAQALAHGLDAESGWLALHPAEWRKYKRLSEQLPHFSEQITWLEPLDLEPLPAKANLLATVLSRVRAALDEQTRKSTSSRRASSILEESAEDTWSLLDRLIRDATFMWEDIPETTDIRSRAEQQIKAADIFGRFQHDFVKTMEGVTRTLAIPRSGGMEHAHGILVLPIDNVDRSIEHLSSLVKFTRMVTSRRLWYVLAAGHEEFQLFMERSSQKELIVSGQAGIGPKGQDETLAIARRQAATTLRRALPPSYRIGLKPVTPEEAWSFQGALERGIPEQGLTLGKLLKELALPTSSDSRPRGQKLTAFADLFEISALLDDSVEKVYRSQHQQEEPSSPDTAPLPILTSAARMALTLPARTLRDLWHFLYREWKNSQADEAREGEEAKAERAIRVATEMLRNVIDESALPAWASQQLHNRMLRHDVQGRIILDLTGKPVSRAKRTTLSGVLDLSRSVFLEGNDHKTSRKEDMANSTLLMSELHLRRIHDVLLELTDLDNRGNRVPLPPSVAGWFMLLHDLLMLFDEPRVLNVEVSAHEISPELVVTRHELWVQGAELQPSVKLDFLWSLPTWDMFIDFNIFTEQWNAFLHETQGLFNLGEGKYNENEIAPRFRYVLAAWVENVCSVAGDKRGGWTMAQASSVRDSKLSSTALENYEQRVRAEIAQLAGKSLINSRGYDRVWMARAWLERILPLMMLPEFAPSHELTLLLEWPSKERDDKAWGRLVEFWRRHLHPLTRNRQNLVRAVASRNLIDELPSSSAGASASKAKLIHAWVDHVVRAWFEVVDEKGERDNRPSVLQRMAPLLLDEERSRQRKRARQEASEAVVPQ